MHLYVRPGRYVPEPEIINTIEKLEDATSSIAFNSFVCKCVEYLESKSPELSGKEIHKHISSLYKTSFQSEMFLKFWPLLQKLIEKRLKKDENVSYDVIH